MGIPILEREEGSNLMRHPRKRKLNFIASERIQFLNVFENAGFKGGLELLDGPFNLGGLVLVFGRPGDDMKLEMLNLTEETVDVLDSRTGDEWRTTTLVKANNRCHEMKSLEDKTDSIN